MKGIVHFYICHHEYSTRVVHFELLGMILFFCFVERTNCVPGIEKRKEKKKEKGKREQEKLGIKNRESNQNMQRFVSFF